tara:strand:+ start:5688 stop:6236 length:549 start_codon:yes stop_codon:yes gene_type:complete
MQLPVMLIAATFGLAATPALAQQAQCIQNDTHLVIAQQRSDEAGTDFIIRPPARGKIACRYEQHDGDILIGSPDDPLWYEALSGNYLILTRSTGPQGDLVIYDLATDPSTPLLDLPAADDLTIGEAEITFWERTIAGTAANCPQYAEHQGYGFGSVIVEQRIFDITTGQVRSTGASRCSNTQ